MLYDYVNVYSYIDVFFRNTAGGLKGRLESNVLKPINNKKASAKRKQTHISIKFCNYSLITSPSSLNDYSSCCWNLKNG